MLVGSGEKALVAGDDQMRMFLTQFVGAEALLLQLAIAKIFQKYIGAREQPLHRLAIRRLGEIKHDAAFAAVEQREERSAHATQAAGLVACGWLDLDHFGAQLREDHAAGRTHHHVGHLDDPHAVKRQSRPGHRLLPFGPSEARLGLQGRSGKYNPWNGACTPA